jgi:hypothetical protein
MRVIELFAGTRSFSKVAEARGHLPWTTDIEDRFRCDLTADVLMIEAEDLPEGYRSGAVIWASPPCEKFSVMNIGRNWRMTGGGHLPRNDPTYQAWTVLAKTLCLIRDLRPKFFYIENPVDKMRSLPMMSEEELSAFFGQPVVRRTITQCQYGRDVQKPTDIWTNDLNWVPRPQCKRGEPCHESAPRGSKRGIQGKKGAEARAIMPPALCEELLISAEGDDLVLLDAEPEGEVLL